MRKRVVLPQPEGPTIVQKLPRGMSSEMPSSAVKRPPRVAKVFVRPAIAIFAAVFLTLGGVLNIIWGIAAIGNASFFVHNTHYMFGNLKSWGWITLIIGIIMLLAAASLFGGGTFGRWFGIIAAGLAAIGALLDIPAYPFWSIAIFALCLWIIQGLAVYGEDLGTPERPNAGTMARMPPRQPG